MNLRLFLIEAAVLLLGLAVLTPPRRLWLLPAGLAVVLGALSGFATQSSIEYSRLADKQLLGGENKAWVERAANGPVAFLTGGETPWTAVYENVFWSPRLKRVYTLPGFAIPGPLPQTPVGPETDGRIVLADGRAARARYAVASNTLTLFGRKVAAPAKAKLVLWRIRQPLRLSTWVTGISLVRTSTDPRADLSVGGGMASDAKLVVYSCSGSFKVKLVARAAPAVVRVRRNGSLVRRGALSPWTALHATIPAVPRPGKTGRSCELELLSTQPLDVLVELTRG